MKKIVFTLVFVFGCGASELPTCELRGSSNLEVYADQIIHYLNDHPRIRDAMVWVNDDYPEGCNAGRSDMLRAMIQAAMTSFDHGQDYLSEPPRDSGNDDIRNAYYDTGVRYREQDAISMWIEHIALSLWQETNKVSPLPWSIQEYTDDELSLLLDSRNYISYIGNSEYAFRETTEGGRIGITDWSAFFAYDFLANNDLIGATQSETVLHVTEWLRGNATHKSGKPTRRLYEDRCGSRGYPETQCVLREFEKTSDYHCDPSDPHPCSSGDYEDAATNQHLNPIAGCWAVTSLFSALFQAINIPVRHGHFSFEDGREHARPEFPALGISLVHGDDVYDQYNRKGTWTALSANELYLDGEELVRLIDHPVSQHGWDSRLEAHWNAVHRKIDSAFRYHADELLIERSLELTNRIPHGVFERKNFNFELCGGRSIFPVPLFPAMSHDAYLRIIDNELQQIGSGSVSRGAETVLGSVDYETLAATLRQCY